MYRNQIKQQVGAPIPTFDDDDAEIPEDMEAALSRLVAQASQQLLLQNQTAAAQQQAQQQAQDPILQLQAKELSIKEADLQRKVLKDKTDAQLKSNQQTIEQQRIASQIKIAEATSMVKATAEDEKLKVKKADAMIKAVAEDERMKLEKDKELLRIRSRKP